jgi:hypothetical protein
MRSLRLAPAALVTGAALLIVAPDLARAWVLTGWSLSLNQRTFRVFDNFTDPEANDNLTPDPAFPGATGAVLAIWKGCVEWGSAPHGDGSGDPGQPFGLGSGGANFDPSYQGRAASHGAVGDNVFAELSGCAGGTLAFTESYANGAGWRISFYACYTWEDDPSPTWPAALGYKDLQGAATHEYGHALGLGHTPVIGATMRANTVDAREMRSIEADDIGGVQAIYGVSAPSKPRITGLTWDGVNLTLDGVNFASTNNTVWFTRAGTGTTVPVAVGGLDSSSNGTRLVVAVPANAGPGDVLVRVPGTTGASLSQAWPFDPNPATCSAPVRYCTALPTPAGTTARLDVQGSQSVGTNDFTLVCTDAPPNGFGLFYYGANAAAIPGGDGIICVGPPFYRLPAVPTGATGAASYRYDLALPPPGAAPIVAGTTWHFSFWFRQTSPAGYNFSDGMRVPFCP